MTTYKLTWEATPSYVWDAFALNGEWQKHQAEIVRVERPKNGEWR